MKRIRRISTLLIVTLMFVICIAPLPVVAETTNAETVISSGGEHTVGLKNDGTVVACGWDGDNQVSGVSDWTDIKQVSAGYAHTVALKNDGTVVACGFDDSGQVSVVDTW